QVIELIDDLVVHRPAVLRMRVQQEGDRRIRRLAVVIAAFEPPFGPGNNHIRHVAGPMSTRNDRQFSGLARGSKAGCEALRLTPPGHSLFGLATAGNGSLVFLTRGAGPGVEQAGYLGAKPFMFKRLIDDIDAIRARDPAARSRLEVFFAYPGFHAVRWHRLA